MVGCVVGSVGRWYFVIDVAVGRVVAMFTEEVVRARFGLEE